MKYEPNGFIEFSDGEGKIVNIIPVQEVEAVVPNRGYCDYIFLEG